MRKFRIYAAAVLFLALTAVKLISPTATLTLRTQVVQAVSGSDDYRKAVQTLGEKLGLGKEDKTVSVSDTAESYSPPTIAQLRQEQTSILPEKTAAPQPTASPAPTKDDAAVQSETREAVPAAVQAFLDSQAAYANYAVPADVSYTVPVLPFAFASPVRGTTSSGFGYRMHPILNQIKFHYGTDFAAQSGTDVLAFADGTVETAAENDSFGKYLVISHAGGYKTLYAHCSALCVAAGDAVKLGQKIALVGQTGSATGPHLHFELSCGGVYYNPEFYI